MNFSRSVTEIIRERISVRKYQSSPLSDSDIRFLEDLLETLPETPFRSGSRFCLIAPEGPHDFSRLPGTYGVIRGARMYLAGGAKDTFKSLLDFGYAMEHIILHAWDRGLGTCWLAGTFQRSVVERYVDFPPEYIIPAITPVGYSAEKEGLVDEVLHRIMGSRHRKPFEALFYENDGSTPLQNHPDQDLATALEMVRLAPSGMNQQPWRAVVDDGAVHFYVHRRGLSSFLYKGMLPLLDVGAACCHFALTMQELERPGTWLESERGKILEKEKTRYCLSWQWLESQGREGDS